MSKIYWQERNHDNWTGRVSRQSRITGEWSTGYQASKRIPKMAYVGAMAFVAMVVMANFL